MGQVGFLKIIYIAKPIRIPEWKTTVAKKSLVVVRNATSKKNHQSRAPVIDVETNTPMLFLIQKPIGGIAILIKNITSQGLGLKFRYNPLGAVKF
jgi:hypothetical protein